MSAKSGSEGSDSTSVLADAWIIRHCCAAIACGLRKSPVGGQVISCLRCSLFRDAPGILEDEIRLLR
jgi:hypothetical protein